VTAPSVDSHSAPVTFGPPDIFTAQLFCIGPDDDDGLAFLIIARHLVTKSGETADHRFQPVVALGDQSNILIQSEQPAEHGQLRAQLFQVRDESLDPLKAECGDIAGASMGRISEHCPQPYGLGPQSPDIRPTGQCPMGTTTVLSRFHAESRTAKLRQEPIQSLVTRQELPWPTLPRTAHPAPVPHAARLDNARTHPAYLLDQHLRH
jgi:hypothetical protein